VTDSDLPITERPPESYFESNSKEDLYASIQKVYLADERPWVIGYSGGKDSTAAVQAVWNAVAALPIEDRRKTVYVISSDTYVETPVIVDHITNNLDLMNAAAITQGLPFEAQKVSPKVEDTFWVCLLGKGYPAPTTRFRWCTDRMKIRPADNFIVDKVTKFGSVVVVLGARRGESGTRDQVLKAREIEGSVLRRHTSLANAYVYSPVEYFSADDVWDYLHKVPSPWGADNAALIGMYRSASKDGECPLVVDTSTPSCGNSRFGCWVCTVVESDSSMEAIVENGEEWMEPLLDFRDELATHKDPAKKFEIRQVKRRNGKVMTKEDGTPIPGPYKPEQRQRMLRSLLEMQKEVQENGPDPNEMLIRPEELLEIRRIWSSENADWEDSVKNIYLDVYGDERPIAWGRADVTTLRAEDAALLKEHCQTDDVPWQLVARLIDLERDMQGMTKRANIFAKIDRIFKEDWLEEQRLQKEFELEAAEGELDNEVA